MLEEDYYGLDEQLDMGPCCSCGKTDVTVRNIVLLSKKAPIAGTGWGCVICQLPSDGAMAVLCDDCAEIKAFDLKEVIHGYAVEKKRSPYSALTESFEHKDVPH